MRFDRVRYHGRANTLPFWFSLLARAAGGLRASLAASRGIQIDWGLLGMRSADIRHVGFGMLDHTSLSLAPAGCMAALAMPSEPTACFFGDASGEENRPPTSGPVLVMPPAQQPRNPHRWLQRLWLVVFVLFCLEVGIVLTVLPWTPLWTGNSLLISFPAVKEFLGHGFVRGLVSGLGLVDIWMGVVEAVTYRERPRQ